MLPEGNIPLILPLLNLTTKSLTVNGKDVSKTVHRNMLVREEMERFGFDFNKEYKKLMKYKTPDHLKHKSWCEYQDSICTCQLVDPSPSKITFIRMEATDRVMETQVKYANTVAQFGELKLMEAMKECFLAQTRRFTDKQEMSETFVYPILDTPWNRRNGVKACVPIIPVDENITSGNRNRKLLHFRLRDQKEHWNSRKPKIGTIEAQKKPTLEHGTKSSLAERQKLAAEKFVGRKFARKLHENHVAQKPSSKIFIENLNHKGDFGVFIPKFGQRQSKKQADTPKQTIKAEMAGKGKQESSQEPDLSRELPRLPSNNIDTPKDQIMTLEDQIKEISFVAVNDFLSDDDIFS